MNNKLDSFNKDKFKCQKCKEYYDKRLSIAGGTLCINCNKKWEALLLANEEKHQYIVEDKDQSYHYVISEVGVICVKNSMELWKKFINEK